jgi:hypothetical protein
MDSTHRPNMTGTFYLQRERETADFFQNFGVNSFEHKNLQQNKKNAQKPFGTWS